jgi:transposase
MGKTRTIELSGGEKQALEEGYRSGKSHAFRKRCQLVLLKGQGRTSKDVGQIIGMNHISVNNWLDRYQAEGILGLVTKPGRGRKPVLDQVQDAVKVRKAVEQERQRLSQAKQMLEETLDKEFSLKTLKRFLKKLNAGTEE